MKQNEISEFYDEYVKRQIKTGANERLISLYKRLLNGGLNTDSKVLELGCGVGIFTKLLAKKVKNGIIEAVDLSAKSVAVARNELKYRKNIQFDVADVVKYQPKNSDFDMITLMDVIEHIPLEHHAELFRNLAEIATEKTNILINARQWDAESAGAHRFLASLLVSYGSNDVFFSMKMNKVSEFLSRVQCSIIEMCRSTDLLYLMQLITGVS